MLVYRSVPSLKITVYSLPFTKIGPTGVWRTWVPTMDPRGGLNEWMNEWKARITQTGKVRLTQLPHFQKLCVSFMEGISPTKNMKFMSTCVEEKYQLGVCVCPHFPHTKHFGAPSWKNIPPFSLPFWWKQNICLVWWHFLWQESFTLKKTKSNFQEFGRVPILLCWSIGLLYLDLLKMLQKRGQIESGEEW